MFIFCRRYINRYIQILDIHTHIQARACTHAKIQTQIYIYIDVTKRPEEEMCYDLFYLPISYIYITHSFLIWNTISIDLVLLPFPLLLPIFVPFLIFTRFSWKFTRFTKTCLDVHVCVCIVHTLRSFHIFLLSSHFIYSFVLVVVVFSYDIKNITVLFS